LKKKTKFDQTTLFEFKPDETVTLEEIMELSELIRIGVCGSTLSNASPQLKRHFELIENKRD
jgi:hypothetical protein